MKIKGYNTYKLKIEPSPRYIANVQNILCK